jgi:hypothetical protein
VTARDPHHAGQYELACITIDGVLQLLALAMSAGSAAVVLSLLQPAFQERDQAHHLIKLISCVLIASAAHAAGDSHLPAAIAANTRRYKTSSAL